MERKEHNEAVTLNERVMSFIKELNENYGNYIELPEMNEQLTRISKHLHSQSLKPFNDENNRNNET